MPRRPGIRQVAVFAAAIITLASAASANTLKTHRIFSSNMVIQRDKPIVIWGWAAPRAKVSVLFGERRGESTADAESGRWEVTFDAQEANAAGQTLTISSGDETIEMDDILIGDVWVMNGQSNMAWGLAKTTHADIERATAHLPLLRRIGISPNESYTPRTDLPDDKVDGWSVCTPETAGGYSAIGYAFASRVQRALRIPIGIIDNARGGASIESLVPRHKFDDDPLAKRYADWVERRRTEFDWDKAMKPLIETWEKEVAGKKEQGVPADQLPPKPTRDNLRSWSVPGRSPSDAGACYNGMFGAFEGLNIKGVLFHQGYNNAMSSACRPKRYRVLMKLMVDGWREDFGDPTLPVGVIGFCAGSIPQTRENFETWTVSGGAFIREAQRLGLGDVADPTNTAFLPAYDVRIPGLHPFKKRQHGTRAARWALNQVYGQQVNWDSAALVSVERDGDRLVLTFDKPVMPDDMSMSLEGFAIADESGKYYLAHAVQPLTKDVGIWNTANKCCDTTKVIVWSPLVDEPVAVRYGWATSPMGNLKVNGKEWLPLQSFRTDDWDWPESEDPAEILVDRGTSRQWQEDAAERLEYRKVEEAKQAVEILERLETLDKLEEATE
jgi:sialate O-acetylesterase